MITTTTVPTDASATSSGNAWVGKVGVATVSGRYGVTAHSGIPGLAGRGLESGHPIPSNMVDGITVRAA